VLEAEINPHVQRGRYQPVPMPAPVRFKRRQYALNELNAHSMGLSMGLYGARKSSFAPRASTMARSVTLCVWWI